MEGDTAAIEGARKSSQEDCHGMSIGNSLKEDLVAEKTSDTLAAIEGARKSSQEDCHVLSIGNSLKEDLVAEMTSDTLEISSMLEDEIFDFDLPSSPERDRGGSASRDDDEEVFFGPMAIMEECMEGVALEDIQPPSPLSPEAVVTGQPGKALVQNAPDLPKSKLSR